MDVILLERVPSLGQMGDVVAVKPGYARNFLLPKGKALRASAENRKMYEDQRAQLEARNLEKKAEAQKVAEKLDGQRFVVIRTASDSGSLYGSVNARDAAAVANEDGFTLDKRQFIIARPIKELGIHPISVNLHPEVYCGVELNVARSEEEAELQAEGKTIQDAEAEAENEAALDIAEVFDNVGAAGLDDEDPSAAGGADQPPAKGAGEPAAKGAEPGGAESGEKPAAKDKSPGEAKGDEKAKGAEKPEPAPEAKAEDKPASEGNPAKEQEGKTGSSGKESSEGEQSGDKEETKADKA